jgi:predicted RNA-binding Zn ribbon-like protein
VLARALRFREALYPLLAGEGEDAHWSVVAGEVERAAGAARFSAPGTWELPETAELPLLAVARAAGELLAAGPTGVRACPGHGCGWLFLDPRGRRRWCLMAVCGNRAKARRHAARSSRP